MSAGLPPGGKSRGGLGAPPPPPPPLGGPPAPPTAPCVAPAGPETGPALIPRDALFGTPDRAAAQISPDGKQISFLAPVNGYMNVWVGPVDKPDDAKPITSDPVRGIRQYFWAYTS